jgi:acyl dehydratase
MERRSLLRLNLNATAGVGADRVRLRITIKSKRESSRPERGHFDLLHELLNQEGDVVLSVLMAGLITRRPRS